MAFARSCIDKNLNRDAPLTLLVDRLQCTALGHPMKMAEPTAAAHAAVTPLTMQARFHNIPMMKADGGGGDSGNGGRAAAPGPGARPGLGLGSTTPVV